MVPASGRRSVGRGPYGSPPDLDAAAWRTSLIANAATSAVAALEALLASRDEWVRLKAAAKILETAIEYNQEALITDKIAALEERANELRAAR